jgi:3-deoxy-D-manno-octulosonic-acid transferase
MNILYFSLVFIIYLFLLPILIIHILFNIKGRRRSLLASFFLFKNKTFKENDIWFHSSSLGETKSTKPIIDKLNKKVNISVSTIAGYNEASKYTDDVRYLPYEIFLPFWIKKHQVLIVIEAEFWYFLFLFAKIRGATTILVNARIKDTSIKKYLFFKYYFKKIFANIDYIFAQSKEDKKRLLSIGAKNIQVFGNIKANIALTTTKKYNKNYKTIIIGASTHNKEEDIILDAFLQAKIENCQLLLAPRHSHRFDKIDKLISTFSKKHSLSYSRFSKNNNIDTNIVLVDTIGDLNNLYNISDIVILGGSFIQKDDVGGHNPLEPAYFQNKLITGAYTKEQQYTFNLIKNYTICKKTNLLYKDIQNIHKNTLKTTIINKLDISKIIDTINKAINEI